jgi:hypothetical protein
MTTDPNGWFLTSQALDHRETVAALTSTLPEWSGDGYAPSEDGRPDLASFQATELARAGYALVRLTPGQHERTEDLSPFLSRKED